MEDRWKDQYSAEGWLARTHQAFPEQFVGSRFAIRGTHVRDPLLASAATIAAQAERHHDVDPSLARAAYRLAIAQYTHLEQTAPNPGSAAAARQTAELLAKRLAKISDTAT